ncbi:MAG: tRNA (adenosine(37)-N6)-dimethylallyltransferase MiaA [Bacteroidales bacterium]|nr:tRNA (adenosine(37)-N6)-dimethylallyltransferase MiaA [Bacteroidales bacterium]
MRKLLVITGPTAVGKTELSLQIAERLGCPIISADSRQVYRELSIGTAAPTAEEQSRVRHYLVQSRSIEDYYSAYEFEQDALRILEEIYRDHDVAVVTGGSMMYIDALCNGIDDIPTISDEIRQKVWSMYEEHGLDHMLAMLQTLDPQHYDIVDRQNYKRVIHAIEICLQSGTTYTSLRTNKKKERPFEAVKVVIDRDRQELFDRINRRVDIMDSMGLEDEARRYFPMKHLNSLNTVGYKEMFDYFEGKTSREMAIEKIKTNTRRYAKKQLTWFRYKGEYTWFDASEDNLADKIIALLE